jgi:hypothetical protein
MHTTMNIQAKNIAAVIFGVGAGLAAGFLFMPIILFLLGEYWNLNLFGKESSEILTAENISFILIMWFWVVPTAFTGGLVCCLIHEKQDKLVKWIMCILSGLSLWICLAFGGELIKSFSRMSGLADYGLTLGIPVVFFLCTYLGWNTGVYLKRKRMESLQKKSYWL